MTMYLDGEEVATGTYSGGGDETYALGIGNADASSHDVPFNGIIDEIRISSAARSADEIAGIRDVIKAEL